MTTTSGRETSSDALRQLLDELEAERYLPVAPPSPTAPELGARRRAARDEQTA